MKIPIFKSDKFILCDDSDYYLLTRYTWRLDTKKNYPFAMTYCGGKSIRLSVIDALKIHVPDGKEIDHKNRNKLDWHIENLRLCTHSQNNMNKGKYKDNGTIYKGVFPINKRWRVQIVKDRKTYVLGTYDDEEFAANIYDAAARALHGEYAVLNFPNQNMLPKFNLEKHLDMIRYTSSKYKGITFSKLENKWKASIYVNKKKIHVGTFSTEEIAYTYQQQAIKQYENN